MDTKTIIEEAKKRFSESVERFASDIKSIRTGRANASMLDGIVVDAYETTIPLNQVATVSVADATLLQVTPFDPNNIEAISAGIRANQTLSLNPTDDGRVIRIPIPPLTEERRKEIVRLLSSKVEEAAIRNRNIRHDQLNKISQLKKDKAIGEDEAKRSEKEIDDSLAKIRTEIDSLFKEKEQEIMTI